MTHPTQPRAHRLGVGGLRITAEVGLPIRRGPPKVAEIRVNDSPVPGLAGIVGIQEQEPPADLERFVPGLLLEIDRLEIVQHPDEELPLADRGEMLLLKDDGPAHRPGHDLLASLGSQDGPAVERVQQDPAPLFRLKSHDEVGREADAVDRQPDPPADLDQEQAERDRDAEAPVENLVEKAVSRIVVLLDVSAESLLLEEKLANAVKAAERVLPRTSGPGGGGEAVQPAEVRPDVQVGVLRSGDEQRGGRQIDLGLRPLDRDGEVAE